MHECELCGQACGCDMEDHWQPAPGQCVHACPADDDSDIEDDECDADELFGDLV